MIPFDVPPGWFGSYYFSDRLGPRRKPLRGSIAHFALLVVLVGGGAIALSPFSKCQRSHVQRVVPLASLPDTRAASDADNPRIRMALVGRREWHPAGPGKPLHG